MKKTNKFLLILTAVATLLLPASVLAETPNSTATTPTAKSNQASSSKEANQQAIITRLKNKGDNEINRRLSTLNTLSSSINASTKLDADSKAALTIQVQNEITGLNGLKSKLDAETDLATLRGDIKAIFDDYRVYALIVPKVHLVAAADRMQAAIEKLQALAAKLNDKILAAQAKGKDVTSLITTYNDLIAKLNDAKAKYVSVEKTTLVLQPSDYNANHAVLMAQRDTLKQGRTSLQAARDDVKSIVNGLKNLKAIDTSATTNKPQ